MVVAVGEVAELSVGVDEEAVPLIGEGETCVEINLDFTIVACLVDLPNTVLVEQRIILTLKFLIAYLA